MAILGTDACVQDACVGLVIALAVIANVKPSAREEVRRGLVGR